jgi:hypothetical protein
MQTLNMHSPYTNKVFPCWNNNKTSDVLQMKGMECWLPQEGLGLCRLAVDSLKAGLARGKYYLAASSRGDAYT